jgi:hypothetical protein
MFAQSKSRSFDDTTSIHASYSMFEQVSDQQFSALLMEVGRTNQQVHTNARNLVKIGEAMQRSKSHRDSIEGKVEKNRLELKKKLESSGFTKSQIESIIDNFHGYDIDLIHSNLISLGNSQKAAKSHRDSIEAKVGKGGGFNKSQIENIIRNFPDIKLIHSNLISLGDSQKAAKKHRDSIELKTDEAKAEHSSFHSKFNNLGIALTEAKSHRDSIEDKVGNKSDKGHSHGGGGGEDECAWYDIFCKAGETVDETQKLMTIGLLGIGALVLLKR